MIWTKNQIIGCRFENSLNSADGEQFTANGTISYGDGFFGKELDLTSSGSFVELGGINTIGNKIDGAKAITISMFVTPTTLSPSRQDILYIPNYFPTNRGAGLIFGIRNNTSFDIRGRSRGISTSNNVNENLSVSNVFSVSIRHHLVGIFDFENKELVAYVNGVEVGIADNLGWLDDEYSHSATGGSGQAACLGADANLAGSNKFTGFVDEFQVWRTRLSESDIKRIYHGLHPLNG